VYLWAPDQRIVSSPRPSPRKRGEGEGLRCLRIRNNSMTPTATNLQIDSARLWDTIHETAKFGATPKGGVRRLTLGPEDKQVRDWFRNACEAAGLEVNVDALGSMFGLRPGRDMSRPPVGLGSHLDTQPTGGKYDGVLG